MHVASPSRVLSRLVSYLRTELLQFLVKMRCTVRNLLPPVCLNGNDCRGGDVRGQIETWESIRLGDRGE